MERDVTENTALFIYYLTSLIKAYGLESVFLVIMFQSMTAENKWNKGRETSILLSDMKQRYLLDKAEM
jgi:hypothetical protein